MSGVRRAILAELAAKGITGEEAMKAMSPEGFREEKGRSKNEDTSDESYIGKNAQSAK